MREGEKEGSKEGEMEKGRKREEGGGGGSGCPVQPLYTYNSSVVHTVLQWLQRWQTCHCYCGFHSLWDGLQEVFPQVTGYYRDARGREREREREGERERERERESLATSEGR